MRFFLFILLLLPVSAFAAETPETLSASLKVPVIQRGADWIITYPSVTAPQSDGSVWQVGPTLVTLIKPTGEGVSNATIVLPPKSELVAANGAVRKVVTVTKQSLTGKWSFADNMLTSLDGKIGTLQSRDVAKNALVDIYDIGVKANARPKGTLAELDFLLTTGASRAVPASGFSGFLPKTFHAKGTASNVPKSLMVFGAAQTEMAKTGVNLTLSRVALSSLNGVSMEGRGLIRADAAAPYGASGRLQTIWQNVDTATQKLQAGLFNASASSADRSAATQQMIALMLVAGMGVRQGEKLKLDLEMASDGRFLINGKEPIAEQNITGKNPVDSKAQTP
jgi:hypothetical protein